MCLLTSQKKTLFINLTLIKITSIRLSHQLLFNVFVNLTKKMLFIYLTLTKITSIC
jgi:hypothetical protein